MDRGTIFLLLSNHDTKVLIVLRQIYFKMCKNEKSVEPYIELVNNDLETLKHLAKKEI